MNVSEFERIRKQASRVVDRLGMPIDEGILETVVALRVHGINTVASCEGHSDRVTGGPYVMFEALGVQQYVDAYRAILDRLDPEYKRLIKEATIANVLEVQKVLKLLDGFYKNTTVPINRRLIVQHFGPTTAKLMCQGADLAHVLDQRKRMSLLKANQTEMYMFTSYLTRLKVRPPRVP